MSEEESTRLDIALQKQLDPFSRAAVEKLIESGQVKVNSKVVLKPSFRVSAVDKITTSYNPEKIKIPKIKLPVIYEDSDVIVINKPIGVLSHAKGNFNSEATVATWMDDKYEGEKSNRNGIVHRLDRSTSGVMILAKNEQAGKWLQKQFSTRKVKKTYIAIVSGHLEHSEAIIDLPIERNPKSPQSFRVGNQGKSAQTQYKVLESNDKFSLLELKPTTGRTHQLRVHLAHIGHPIVGDSFYKGLDADRLYLHSQNLELTLLSKQRMTFSAPLPKEFKIYMNK